MAGMAEHDLTLHRVALGPTYGEDWAAWLQKQINLLKQRRYDELDHDNLIDEVEGLGKSDFKGFVSAIEIVLLHMLKWEHQPAFQSKSWAQSIDEHRERITWELQDSPSYKARLEEAVFKAYQGARYRAETQTGLSRRTFPVECPYDWTEIMTRELRFTSDPA